MDKNIILRHIKSGKLDHDENLLSVLVNHEDSRIRNAAEIRLRILEKQKYDEPEAK